MVLVCAGPSSSLDEDISSVLAAQGRRLVLVPASRSAQPLLRPAHQMMGFVLFFLSTQFGGLSNDETEPIMPTSEALSPASSCSEGIRKIDCPPTDHRFGIKCSKTLLLILHL